MAALHSYFDGSYTGRKWTEGGFVTLAGFAADDSMWAEFDVNWKRILADNRNRPSAAYLHMKEAAHLEGEFSIRNGWNLKKVSFLINDLLMYLGSMDKLRFHEFACTIDLSAQAKIENEGIELEDPITRCNRLCPEAVLQWYFVKYPDKVIHSAYFFFDRDEPFEEPFRKKWSSEIDTKLDRNFVPHDIIWSIIKSVTSAITREQPALQAADLLAWASNRAAGPKDRSFGHVELLLKGIVGNTWSYWGEPELRTGRMNLPKF